MNFTIEISVLRRLWYWPFAKKPIRIRVDKKFSIIINQRGEACPMLVSGYASNDGRLTTVMSCGDDADGVEKVRFKRVTGGTK